MDTDNLDRAVNETRARVAYLASTVLDRPELLRAAVIGVEVNGWSGHVEIVFADPSERVAMGMNVNADTPAAELVGAVVQLEQVLAAREEARELRARLAGLGVQE